LLLYADDTILFAECKSDPQSALVAMFDNCKGWDLQVNEDKTKIVIFSKKKVNPIPITL
jgi:hypothetical protein